MMANIFTVHDINIKDDLKLQHNHFLSFWWDMSKRFCMCIHKIYNILLLWALFLVSTCVSVWVDTPVILNSEVVNSLRSRNPY